MSVTIKNERTTPALEFEMDGLTPAEAKHLRDYGWKHIQSDDEALINYGFMHYLKVFSGDIEKNIVYLNKLLEQKKTQPAS